jgi:hypothetical protein
MLHNVTFSFLFVGYFTILSQAGLYIVEWYKNDELERIWKEAAKA